MATDMDRKKLWGRSGSRCAMCSRELTQVDGVDSIVGDEAHIRSKSEGGPRHDPDYPLKKVDGYDNLILLCKVHHKLVDDNEEVLPTGLLETIKAKHERRVGEALSSRSTGWVRQAIAVPMEDGTQLMALVASASGYVFSNDHPANDDEREAIARFVGSVQDWCDISSDIGASGRVDAAADLHEQMLHLGSLGFIVFAALEDYRMQPDFIVPAVAVHVARVEEKVGNPPT